MDYLEISCYIVKKKLEHGESILWFKKSFSIDPRTRKVDFFNNTVIYKIGG